jgi:hypothetical protein
LKCRNLCLAVVIAIAVGCKPAQSLEGRWSMSSAELGTWPAGTVASAEFAGGRVTHQITVPYGAGKGMLTATGTYTLKGSAYSQMIEDVRYDEEFKRLCSLRVVPQVDEIGIKNAMNRDKDAELAWNSDEQALLTSPTGTVTLTRLDE